VAGDERADRHEALGDPRPLVQQPRDLGERLEVDLDELPTERERARERVLPGRGGGAVAAERRLIRSCAA